MQNLDNLFLDDKQTEQPNISQEVVEEQPKEVLEQVVEQPQEEPQVEYSEEDLKPYLVDSEGNKYYFDKPISRNFRLELMKNASGLQKATKEQDFVSMAKATEDIVRELIKYNYPDKVNVVEDILDSSATEFGDDVYLEACGIIVEKVFTKAGATEKKVPTFVLAHRSKKQ